MTSGGCSVVEVIAGEEKKQHFGGQQRGGVQSTDQRPSNSNRHRPPRDSPKSLHFPIRSTERLLHPSDPTTTTSPPLLTTSPHCHGHVSQQLHARRGASPASGSAGELPSTSPPLSADPAVTGLTLPPMDRPPWSQPSSLPSSLHSSPSSSASSSTGSLYSDLVITEELHLSSPLTPTPPFPTSPPTPLHLSTEAAATPISFSSLSSSITSLHTAIARLSDKLAQPQPVYIIDPKHPSSPPSPPTPLSSPPSHPPATRRHVRPRGKRPLPPSVEALIHRQQQLMADLMALLSLKPSPHPSHRIREWEAEREVRGGRLSPFQHLQVDEEEERPRFRQPPPRYLRRPSKGTVEEAEEEKERGREDPPILPTASASRRVSASTAGQRRGSAMPPLPPPALVAPAVVHPLLDEALQAELDALHRKEERWKGRLKSTRTQRMREERVRTKTREEEEERKRREEEEEGERTRKALIERAMRERRGDSRAQDGQQGSVRIEWIKRRDGMDRPYTRPSPRSSSPPHRRRRGQVDFSPPSQRRYGRNERGSDLSEREEVVEQREAVPRRSDRRGRAEKAGDAELFSVEQLRSLGYAVTDDEADDLSDCPLDDDAASTLARLGLYSHSARHSVTSAELSQQPYR